MGAEMENVLIIVGFLIALGCFVYWLARSNADAQRRMAEVLGLQLAPARREERGANPAGFPWRQSLLMTGTMQGRPAEVWLRAVRQPGRSTERSIFTALVMPLSASLEGGMRIEPASIGALIAMFGSDQAPVPTDDATFDRYFRVTSTEASLVSALLTPELRARLLEWRAQVTGAMPDTALGRFAGDLLAGVFALERGRATYAVSGSPSQKIAEHLKLTAPVLADLAGRVEGQGRDVYE